MSEIMALRRWRDALVEAAQLHAYAERRMLEEAQRVCRGRQRSTYVREAIQDRRSAIVCRWQAERLTAAIDTIEALTVADTSRHR